MHEPDDDAEYAVPVKWLYTTELANAFSETGLFGNQNSVCKPTAAKWAHTIQRLCSVWPMREK
ncbi:hypothetical protein GCM10011297_05730 [Bacterioplanes sanyensis]|uniref:hypothetical protein n=1 Tax=Bacterioplanes sanyensis TaxID=1249553 RepID=UPI001673E711|nr:hypothetical protein [Bacterioplanes sanyensis]GGY35451.1 hypothetical protein GCM10011297_05730 [Bacterioplanes sanyensis]